jgi:hypothetical protein
VEAAELEAYNDWLAEHMEEIVAQYAGRVVAIQEGRILFVVDSEVEAYRWARAVGCTHMPLAGC